MCVKFSYAQGLGAERVRVRLVAGAGARARGADEHVVLLLPAVRPGILLLVDPGAVALDRVCCSRPARVALLAC